MVDDSQTTEVLNQQSNVIVVTSNNACGLDEQVITSTGNENYKKRGRGPTINATLAKKKANGQQIDVQFPPPYYKVCGKHAKLFKSEVTILIRQLAPLRVLSWKEIPKHDMKAMWIFLKVRLNIYCTNFKVRMWNYFLIIYTHILLF
ncbi:hypothetical protein IHE45_02G039200 [Dioscorea alata]|uniref:Uncharacterized protein n=1 Tax=Dioscorea alata TaxID=55571 RepID=A0ACB7WQ84_DIOAL|nr:hypothetical protein IHE45_02G039200 [Dioscorea alata]